jgi:hypothetical protein
MAKTRTRVPPREEYVRGMAEALAVLRRGLEMVDGLQDLPEEGFARLWKGGLSFDKEFDLAWLLEDLRGITYNLTIGVDHLEGPLPSAVLDLAERLTVELVEEDEAGQVRNPNVALAGG